MEKLHPHFTIDSRLVKQGSTFIALEGEKADGHSFLEEVKNRGGQAAIVREKYAGENFGLELIRVRSPLEYLQKLAQDKIESKKPQVVGITGSVGKTTTKEWLSTCLSAALPVAFTKGSENTKCTLPLTILNHWQEENNLVLEMGMTHRGDLTRLTQIAPPDIAVITSIALTHAVNFSSLKGIAEAKSEIFSQNKTTFSVIPYEVNEKETLLSFVRTPYKTFSSLHPEADLFVTTRKEWLVVLEEGRELLFPNPHLPDHHLSNLAAALLVARHMGVTWEQIETALPQLKLPSKRMEWVEKKGVRFLNDCYNANLVSTKGALKAFGKENGRKIFIFGEIRELGPFSKECHEEIGHYSLDHADLLLALGPDGSIPHQIWQDKGRESFHFLSKAELFECLKTRVNAGDLILLKGSKSHSLWTILEDF